MYDVAANTFALLPGDMTTGRIWHGCLVNEERSELILAGGHGIGYTPINTVEILEMDTGIWRLGQSHPLAGQVTFIKDPQLDQLIVLKSGVPNNVYEYNWENDAWMQLLGTRYNQGIANGYEPGVVVKASTIINCQ